MSEPIRVLMLFTIMNRGGAESMVMNYYRHIDRTKVQFDFMVHRQERGAYDDEIEALGGKIFRMLPLRPPFTAYKKQIKQFFDEHPEYQIIHGHCSESGYFVYKEAAKRGVPHIIAHAHSAKALFDLKWFFRTYFKIKMRNYITQGFTCGNEAGRWLLGNKMAKKAIYQANAIDTRKFLYDVVVRREKRSYLNIPGDALVICHVGSFWKIKNQSFLVDVFKSVHENNNNTYLLFVGEGELRKQIESKVFSLNLNENILFMGSRNDVPDLLKMSDIYVFPSLGEGFSMAMLEAQCAGLPIIASDTIPHEIALTDLITFLPLNAGPDFWAEKVLNRELNSESRWKYPQQIVEAGYDIQENATWLQNYYLSLVK